MHTANNIERLLKGGIFKVNRYICIFYPFIKYEIYSGKLGNNIENILYLGILKLQGDRFIGLEVQLEPLCPDLPCFQKTFDRFC